MNQQKQIMGRENFENSEIFKCLFTYTCTNTQIFKYLKLEGT